MTKSIHRHQTPPGIDTSFTAVAALCSLHLLASRPLWPNVMSSIKPEIHNVISQCRCRGTEPRLQRICTQNVVKIGPAVPEICSRIDRQAHRRTNIWVDDNTLHPTHLNTARSNDITTILWWSYLTMLMSMSLSMSKIFSVAKIAKLLHRPRGRSVIRG